MTVFVDQSGQCGGAELCLADIAAGLGGQVVLLESGPFASLLQDRGVGVTVVDAPEVRGIGKAAGPLGWVGVLPAALGLLGRLRREFSGRHILYFNTAKALIVGVAASIGLPCARVFHLHDLLLPEHFSAANIRLLVLAANRCDLVIANSRATADVFQAAGGTVPVEVVPNGFDPAPFDAVTEAMIRSLRMQWNPEGRRVVAMFGRITRWKGQDVVLEAMRGLPDAVLWVVGSALFTEDDRIFERELHSAAGTGRVKFLGFQADVPALMQAADVIVHASRAAEPFGRVVVEAMLASRPVIASGAGGPAEIVVDGETGLLVRAGDPQELRDALDRVLGDPDRARVMGRRGRVRAESLYSLPAVIDKTRRLLAGLSQ
ncbi:MAG: glycosyltransferase family 4 protein [Terrimicrobiaceae bacterium]|nr:glycosyltransferase family 4 protein [Terrimicrobiaceae bacterium]